MAQAKRSEVGRAHNLPDRPVAGDKAYDPGSQIGQMHADLAQRLLTRDIAQPPEHTDSSVERAVRFVSVTGGYLALIAAYAGIALLILR